MSGFKDTLARNVTDNDAYTRRVFGELKVKEKDFQAQLMQVVEMLGGLTYHANDSRREVKRNGKRVLVGDADAKGYPDLTIVLKDGAARRVLWAELKIGLKQPTDEQWIWLRGLPDHQAYLWRPDDWDDAVRIIQYGHRQRLGAEVFYNGQAVSSLMFDREATCIACQNYGAQTP